MASSTCFSHGLNGLSRDVTLKNSRGQRYAGLPIVVSQNNFTNLLVGPRKCITLHLNLYIFSYFINGNS